MNEIKILAIETSCDETAAAVVADGKRVLSDVVHTQIPVHTLYGGVVPEIASRNHLEKIDAVISKALSDCGCTLGDMDAIAVTYGPGLVGALLVGLSEAKAISFASKKPLIGVHHIDGHICACYLEHDIEPPFISLVVSGGHTSLVHVKDYGVYELVAVNSDDAAGEAFDKVARAIGLGYPGGPKIEEAAKSGDANTFTFPHPKISGSYDFSFSGLKTAVLNTVNSFKMKNEQVPVNDIAAAFQKTVTDTLMEHTFAALETTQTKIFTLCGGVAANETLKAAFKDECEKRGIQFVSPSRRYCTDNAAMIGAAAYHSYRKGEFAGLDLNAVANLKL